MVVFSFRGSSSNRLMSERSSALSGLVDPKEHEQTLPGLTG
jgi:hypothetical protein